MPQVNEVSWFSLLFSLLFLFFLCSTFLFYINPNGLKNTKTYCLHLFKRNVLI